MQHYGTGKLPECFKVPDPAACRQTIAEIARHKLIQAQLRPGARELLQELHRYRHIALVSSARSSILDTSLHRHQIEHLFDHIVSGQDVRQLKPHPEGIEQALDRMNANKQSAVMVGDSDKDIQAAKNAGIDSILIYPPDHETYYSLERLKATCPTHIVRSLFELRPLLLQGATL